MVAGGPGEGAGTHPRLFFGWRVIAGLFVMNMITSGFGFYAQGPFLRDLRERNGFSTGVAGIATALFFASSGVAGYVIARLIQRVDVRRVMLAGGIWGAAMLALFGQVRAEWQVFAVNILFGIGFAMCGLVPANTVATRWFVRRRSVAISVSATGLSLGGIVITRQVAVVVSERGLAATTPWFALIWLIAVTLVAVFVVKPSPQSMGLQPDGDPGPPPGSTSSELPGMRFVEARASRFFRLVTVCYVFLMMSQVGALAHQTSFGTDAVNTDLGNLAVSLTAGASVVGRLIGGLVVTRMSSRTFTALLIFVQGAALGLLAQADTAVSFALASLVLGLSVGNLLMLHPLLLAEAYGVREYPRIYGLSNLFMTLGVSLGPAVLGLVHDAADYPAAFTLMGMASGVALVLFLLAGPVEQKVTVTPQGVLSLD
ncbi:MAG: MFS transporter [Acidimicrobiia bacterium]|nr:MFS transporter [Acidimicrobiia bacterium]